MAPHIHAHIIHLGQKLLGPCLPLIAVLSVSVCTIQCNAFRTRRLLYSLNCTFHTCQLEPHNLGIFFTPVDLKSLFTHQMLSHIEFSTPIEAGLPVYWLYVWNYMCLSGLYGAAAVTIDNIVFLIPFCWGDGGGKIFTQFLYYNFAVKIPYLTCPVLSN